MRKASIFLILIGCRLTVASQYFKITDNCRNAYRTAIALQFDSSKRFLQEEKRTTPGNLFIVYVENYIDFLQIYSSGSRKAYDALQNNQDLRLNQLEEGDKNSPYFLYTKAEVNLQWALINVQMGDYLKAVWSLRSAFQQLKENQKRFPQFQANKKSLGVINALLGSVPDNYKWGLSLFGMSADAGEGIHYLEELQQYSAGNDFLFDRESTILYSFLLLHLQNQPQKAWDVLNEKKFPAPGNLMERYAYCYVGVYSKHTDAILNLRKNDRNFATENDRFPMLHFLTGLAYLNHLDNKDAAIYFQHFLLVNRNENHIKAAYQKLAWIAALKNDTAGYFRRMNDVRKYGKSTMDADKQAQKEAETNRFPQLAFLQARLFFDGGYYEKAIEALNEKPAVAYTDVASQTEYFYRAGRIFHEWGKTEDAVICYKKAMECGKNLQRYFAANAAYELGLIAEQRNDKTLAATYFHYVMNFREHEYKNSLDQKAKAALTRLNKK